MKILEDLRRLLMPRARPAAKTATEPTADRPPPAPVVSFPTEPEPTAADAISTEPEPAMEDTIDADDVAEVRAALEAVAAPPASPTKSDSEVATELDVEVAPLASEPAAAAPEPVSPEPDAALFPPPEPAPIAVPAGALVLTLSAPAASFTVARAAATLGRGQENSIRLDDLSVSRRHARIAYRQGAYWLSDLGSMGGTWVDGTRLSAPHRLADGQVIDIGLCRLTVRVAGGGVKADAKKSASRLRSELAGQERRRR